jgi:hypothetical protein
MADVQPSSTALAPAPSGEADSLIDRYLDGLGDEDTEEKPRKVAQSGDPEKGPPENEPEPPEEEQGGDEGEEEGEDTAPEDDAEGEEDDQSGEQGRFVGQDGRVKLPDGSVSTVGELIRGNLRMADYTRKTQETAALHQELQTRQADYAQQEQIVSLAINIMAQALPPEPDPSLLEPGESNDPIGYTNQKLRWEAAAQQLQAMQMAKQQMDERNQAIQGTLLKRYANEQKEVLLAYKPELRDRSKLEAFNNRILRTISHFNWTADDLANVYDARVIIALDKLGDHFSILAARQKARQKGQGKPVLAPGPRQSAAGRKARTQSRDWETLRKTGGRGDGAAALDRILDDII